MSHAVAVPDAAAALDPVRDHQEIMRRLATVEMPWDLTRSLEFALFRTFAVPTISALLDRTGEFGARPQKRYDDTDLIVSTFYERGYDSEAGRAALRRMNQIHGRFDISNDDFLYVLSCFVFEPIRWMERYAARPMTAAERTASFHLWREIGRRMNIRDIPADMEAFEAFSRAYERLHFRYTDANRRVGGATRDLFLGWVMPRVLFPLGAPVVHALLDEPLLAAFGFPAPPPLLRRTVEAGLRLRARAAALLPRGTPRLRTQMRHRSYPGGYRIEELGPPPAGTR